MRVFFLWIKGAIEGIRHSLKMDNKVPVESTESDCPLPPLFLQL